MLKLSNGDVGYMHITAMGAGGVMQFDKFWRAFRYKKGLVIDVRGNGGGWTEYFMIDKLERQQVAFNVLKGMQPYRYPNPASRAHFVLVSNEDNGSDGEAFVEHFKARQLGTVVGRAVVGRARRDRQRAAHDRQRARRAVEQRLLRARTASGWSRTTGPTRTCSRTTTRRPSWRARTCSSRRRSRSRSRRSRSSPGSSRRSRRTRSASAGPRPGLIRPIAPL